MGFVSNLTGELAGARLIGRADYWRRHAREPVLFAAAVNTLQEQGVKIFLETRTQSGASGYGAALSEGRTAIVAAFTPFRTRGLAADVGELAGTLCRRRRDRLGKI